MGSLYLDSTRLYVEIPFGTGKYTDLFCSEKCGDCKCEKVNTFSNEGVPFLKSADILYY